MRRRILLVLATTSLLPGGEPLVRAVDAIGITVEDLDRSLEFYTRVLQFQKVSEFETHGAELERQTGVFGARVRTARLKLGGEQIELREFLTPKGAAHPAGSRSNDRWFQHIALIVADMDRAYRWLRAHKVRHASSAPQRLPDWNPNAGGIQAFYFLDPDGHALEILSFPAGKGAEKWRELARSAQPEQLFLGIDHTAIVIQDTEASLRFYRDLLGLQVAGESENHGVEQEHLNNVFGARLRITALRAAVGPGIEFLEYLAPRDGRPYPPDAKANDLLHWQTKLSGRSAAEAARTLRNNRTAFVSAGVEFLPAPGESGSRSIVVRDPDGHAIEIVEQPSPHKE
jgi:catechol 2,3-dioxygenase-like lactoylglutathione lyase family enzyme